MHYLAKNYLELKLSLLGIFYKSFGLTFKYFYQICNKLGIYFNHLTFSLFKRVFLLKVTILATVNFPKNEQHHREQVVFFFFFFFFFLGGGGGGGGVVSNS